MVSRAVVVVVVLIVIFLAVEARAQAADWSRAGGGLFPSAASIAGQDVSTPASSEPASIPTPVQPWAEAIAAAAAAHGLDEKLLHAVVVVESAYRAQACSPAGACGLAQLMPATARELGVRDRFDPVDNLHGGARYLAEQIARFGDLRLALAAYNAGPGRVARLGRIPAMPETQAYVTSVVDCYLALTAGRSIRTARDCRGAAP